MEPTEMNLTMVEATKTKKYSRDSAAPEQPKEKTKKMKAFSGEASSRKRNMGVKIVAFAAQCTKCQKWRRIAEEEKYAHIRANAKVKPFECAMASERGREVTCETEEEISPQMDESRVWALDKPDIPVAPDGFTRKVSVRTPGGKKFADVVYFAPDGERLRSGGNVSRYLNKHEVYKKNGVNEEQFSFDVPKPLQENYAAVTGKKRRDPRPLEDNPEPLPPGFI